MPFHRRWERTGGEAPLLIEGGCGERDENDQARKGADELAHDIAFELGWRVQCCPADWRLGKRAGPMRNQYMSDAYRPNRAVAFGHLWWPNGEERGTGGMVKILNRGRVLVHLVPAPGVLPA